MVNQFLKERASFAIENNLADDDTWKFLKEVQISGCEVHLVYMSTDDLSILNFRIEQRALAGEHFVRPDIGEERYIVGLKLLNHYIEIPDVLYLIDNSASLVLAAKISKGKILTISPNLPQWIKTYILERLQKQTLENTRVKDAQTTSDVRKLYEELKKRRTMQNGSGKKGPDL